MVSLALVESSGLEQTVMFSMHVYRSPGAGVMRWLHTMVRHCYIATAMPVFQLLFGSVIRMQYVWMWVGGGVAVLVCVQLHRILR